VWSVCGQDYAPKAAADRFAQLEPTVLITADGYLFNGTTHDRRDAVLELATALPTLKATLLVDHVNLPWPPSDNRPSLVIPWEDAATRTEQLACTPVPFDHPLWGVFSCRPCRCTSGTTPTAAVTTTPTSRPTPASGATATGSHSPPTAR
jgi:acetoacetyl-CoA synthetase